MTWHILTEFWGKHHLQWSRNVPSGERNPEDEKTGLWEEVTDTILDFTWQESEQTSIHWPFRQARQKVVRSTDGRRVRGSCEQRNTRGETASRCGWEQGKHFVWPLRPEIWDLSSDEFLSTAWTSPLRGFWAPNRSIVPTSHIQQQRSKTCKNKLLFSYSVVHSIVCGRSPQ